MKDNRLDLIKVGVEPEQYAIQDYLYVGIILIPTYEAIVCLSFCRYTIVLTVSVCLSVRPSASEF